MAFGHGATALGIRSWAYNGHRPWARQGTWPSSMGLGQAGAYFFRSIFWGRYSENQILYIVTPLYIILLEGYNKRLTYGGFCVCIYSTRHNNQGGWGNNIPTGHAHPPSSKPIQDSHPPMNSSDSSSPSPEHVPLSWVHNGQSPMNPSDRPFPSTLRSRGADYYAMPCARM